MRCWRHSTPVFNCLCYTQRNQFLLLVKLNEITSIDILFGFKPKRFYSGYYQNKSWMVNVIIYRFNMIRNRNPFPCVILFNAGACTSCSKLGRDSFSFGAQFEIIQTENNSVPTWKIVHKLSETLPMTGVELRARLKSLGIILLYNWGVQGSLNWVPVQCPEYAW